MSAPTAEYAAVIISGEMDVGEILHIKLSNAGIKPCSMRAFFGATAKHFQGLCMRAAGLSHARTNSSYNLT